MQGKKSVLTRYKTKGKFFNDLQTENYKVNVQIK